MKNSAAILATVALGAVLAIGSATASMARGGEMGGHGGGGMGGGHGGGMGGGTPSIMNHGSGSGGSRSFGGSHGFGDGHHDFHGRHDANAFFGFGPFAYDDGTAAYCERLYRSYDPASGTYLGQHGLRHYCS
ncbi:BA14K family protein [Mesorhizobium kowhaii]|uniref:BA14K family protein n=1 Tax=Mesorhizobium kowhaii TaxID=1300272 RepID=UPI0035F0ED7A